MQIYVIDMEIAASQHKGWLSSQQSLSKTASFRLSDVNDMFCNWTLQQSGQFSDR